MLVLDAGALLLVRSAEDEAKAQGGQARHGHIGAQTSETFTGRSADGLDDLTAYCYVNNVAECGKRRPAKEEFLQQQGAWM